MTIHIERVTTLEGCTVCRQLAGAVWGADAACSAAQMIVHATYGGVVLLAYDGERPVGFLFSFPAQYRGEWVLWSHETAVLPEYLHQGIGRHLKETQRVLAAEIGYRHIAWTYDPLVSRNAVFNLDKLRARIVEYKRNVYGSDPGDQINQGMETDRFVALWETHTDAEDTNLVLNRLLEIEQDTPTSGTTWVLSLGQHGQPELATEPRNLTELVSTDIPLHFTELISTNPTLAGEWRYAFRSAAELLMNSGYKPVSVQRHPDKTTYIWHKEADQR